MDADPGLFGPSSQAWRVGREAVLLLGGRRALLLQLAHPLVAQGVADHSTFPRDRFRRLLTTVDLSLKVLFGSTPDAQQAIDRINAVHQRVEGVLTEDAGPFPRGTPYRASDPVLLLWVHATLTQTSIEFYERFVAPMSAGERDAYYRESREPAIRLGIPEEILPSDYPAFDRYWNEMLRSDQLFVTTTARELGHALLYPGPRLVPRRLLDPLNMITVGTLPPRIREDYGLRWGPVGAAGLRAASAALPRVLALLPSRLRYVPHARGAEKRLGSPPMKLDDRIRISITDQPIDPADAFSTAERSDGAIVTFAGIVRDGSEGKGVAALEYEAYHEMAEKQLREIAGEACERFGVTSIAVLHRTGRLEVGEVSVVVAASAPHRGEAFDACEFVIDTLKTIAAIWKKEQFTDGTSHWVDHP